jgi:hypothetical protein
VGQGLPGLYMAGDIEDGTVVGTITGDGSPHAVQWVVGEPSPEKLGSLGGASWATALAGTKASGFAEVDGTRHAVRLAPAR